MGFNSGKPAKSYFRESYSIHVLATSGGKGVGVRGAGVLTLQNEEQSYFRESYSIHVLATSGGKWVGVGLTTGLQGRWVGWADEKPYVQLMCNSTWCDLEACVRLGDLVRL